jgi:hypothetical protein
LAEEVSEIAELFVKTMMQKGKRNVTEDGLSDIKAKQISNNCSDKTLILYQPPNYFFYGKYDPTKPE